jgi:hypothetical protein
MECLFQLFWLGVGYASWGSESFVVLVDRGPWFGKWSRFASCGVYGPNGMGDLSRIPKEAQRIFYISFLLLSSLGWQLGLPLL